MAYKISLALLAVLIVGAYGWDPNTAIELGRVENLQNYMAQLQANVYVEFAPVRTGNNRPTWQWRLEHFKINGSP